MFVKIYYLFNTEHMQQYVYNIIEQCSTIINALLLSRPQHPIQDKHHLKNVFFVDYLLNNFPILLLII